MTKPIMLLDVDGPLNPFAAKATKRPEGYETHRMRPTGWTDESIQPLRVWLNPEHGKKLKSCGFKIIWASVWSDDANEWISPHIGLPVDLEAIKWGAHNPEDENSEYADLHWKTPQILGFMNENYPGVPFIWIDDEAGKKEQKFLRSNLDQELKVFTINAQKGLEDSDFAEFTEWCENLDIDG